MARSFRSINASCVFGLVASVVMSSGCGGAVAPAVAVGKVGENLHGRAQVAPHGGEVCLLQEALSDKPQSGERPMSDACAKAFKSDRLWRGALLVLGAYGETLETIAEGDGEETTGQLEAALTGISGPGWIQAEETAAADAVGQLAAQMSANAPKDKLEKFIQDAAPHVKTICDGLGAYLDAQAKGLTDVEKEAEKKRTSKTDRRCGSIDNKSVCVSDSALDRLVYGNAYGQVAIMAANHADARDDVAGFCAAHKKLEEAAASGTLGKDETYAGIVDAIKSARGSSGNAPEPAKKTDGAETPAPKK